MKLTFETVLKPGFQEHEPYTEKVFSKLGASLENTEEAVRPEDGGSNRVTDLNAAHLRLTLGAVKNDLRSGSLPDPLIRLFYLHL